MEYSKILFLFQQQIHYKSLNGVGKPILLVHVIKLLIEVAGDRIFVLEVEPWDLLPLHLGARFSFEAPFGESEVSLGA